MCIRDSSITGRGTVATGRVERGTLHVSDEVEIIGIHDDVKKKMCIRDSFTTMLRRRENIQLRCLTEAEALRTDSNGQKKTARSKPEK